MNNFLDDDDATLARNERELTLSTGAILGIFLGLVLLCGACFGVGYNMGRKSTPAPLALNDAPSSSDSPASDNNTPKPPAGSPLDTASSAPIVTPTPAPKPVLRRPLPAPVADDTATTTAATTAPAPAPRTVAPAPAPVVRTVAPSALLPSSSAATPGAGTYMVQVAAVSHQEDAELLLGALRARGYAVSARPNGNDSFIHVQVGPFSSKKDADAMRQRLLADGYNAIVK